MWGRMPWSGPTAALLDGLRSSLDGRRDVTFEPAIPPRAGLVLHSADGSLTVDATLESRLDQAWPRFAIDLMRRLETQGVMMNWGDVNARVRGLGSRLLPPEEMSRLAAG